jgi:hypothetical protein
LERIKIMESKIFASIEMTSAESGAISSTTFSPGPGKKVDVFVQMHTFEDNLTLLEAPDTDCAAWVFLNASRICSGTNIQPGNVVQVGPIPMISTDVLSVGMETAGTGSMVFNVIGVETEV